MKRLLPAIASVLMLLSGIAWLSVGHKEPEANRTGQKEARPARAAGNAAGPPASAEGSKSDEFATGERQEEPRDESRNPGKDSPRLDSLTIPNAVGPVNPKTLATLAPLGRTTADAGALETLFSAKAGESVVLPLDPPLEGVVSVNHLHETGDRVFGVALKAYAGATFSIVKAPSGEIAGHILQPGNTVGYEVSSDAKAGDLIVDRTAASKILCTRVEDVSGTFGFEPAPDTAEAESPSADTTELIIPDLESKPGAARVIYLDFDGEVVENTLWKGGDRIDALPFENQNYIDGIWQSMSEDFAPFDVNVTTVRSVFDAAASSRRCMVIFTPTNDAAPGAGGVAYIGSFGAPVTYMSWVFNRGLNGAAEAGSHEAGHQSFASS